jgi:hypothetical protein
MNQKKITLVGPFTDGDVALLMKVMRLCEQMRPEENFFMTVESNDDTPIKDVKDFLKNNFPAVEGVPFTVEIFNRKQS